MTSARPEAGASAFYDAGSQADTAHAQLLADGRDADAALIERIARQPQATWIGEWVTDPTATVAQITRAAARADEVALLVLYAIPGRDCGLHSAGGVEADLYVAFAQSLADGMDPAAETWVVLEPDALAQMGDCTGQGDRAELLARAAAALSAGGARVYLDIGHSGWRGVDDTLARIERVGLRDIDGFATNTSNHQALDDERAWADQIAEATGLGYLVDTSRNGNGSDGEWCNPSGRALGTPPKVTREWPLEATAWVKAPGESDGECNGGPAAGQWWLEGALELAGNA
ncbi:glycoside hydrolase family 6 protein [Demequina sp. NBRC 110053]|uniref:glycoside hydrolase family 6 protein n=1 Tax=Demequina sp. NBRC 110053 TaxID=1570342 RepID=UPI001356636F|nr:glycoside hydrolase family 6 protein [Demequina sp. NBRC 110053]